MKKVSILLFVLLLSSMLARAKMFYSNTCEVTSGNVGKAAYSMCGGKAPHLKYYVGGDVYKGLNRYILVLEFDQASLSPVTKSVPKGKLLIRTKDGTVIKKDAAYNETKDYVSKTVQKSTTSVEWGDVVTRTTPSQELHHYTAYYQFLFTPEEFKKMSEGILKIRLEADPIFEKEFKKQYFGNFFDFINGS